MSTPAYDNDNVFAKILRGEMPSFKVYEDDDTYVFMDIMPRRPGHCLVIPKVGYRNILDGDTDSIMAVHRTVQKVARASMKAFDADGMTIQQFNESAGGQIVFHYHVHVIPRHEGEKMNPHGTQGDMDEIKANGEKLAAALAA